MYMIFWYFQRESTAQGKGSLQARARVIFAAFSGGGAGFFRIFRENRDGESQKNETESVEGEGAPEIEGKAHSAELPRAVAPVRDRADYGADRGLRPSLPRPAHLLHRPQLR